MRSEFNLSIPNHGCQGQMLAEAAWKYCWKCMKILPSTNSDLPRLALIQLLQGFIQVLLARAGTGVGTNGAHGKLDSCTSSANPSPPFSIPIIPPLRPQAAAFHVQTMGTGLHLFAQNETQLL